MLSRGRLAQWPRLDLGRPTLGARAGYRQARNTFRSIPIGIPA